MKITEQQKKLTIVSLALISIFTTGGVIFMTDFLGGKGHLLGRFSSSVVYGQFGQAISILNLSLSIFLLWIVGDLLSFTWRKKKPLKAEIQRKERDAKLYLIFFFFAQSLLLLLYGGVGLLGILLVAVGILLVKDLLVNLVVHKK